LLDTLQEFENWFPAFLKDYYENHFVELRRVRGNDRYIAVNAFLAGVKAAQQSVQPTVESGRELPAKKSNRKSSAPAKSG